MSNFPNASAMMERGNDLLVIAEMTRLLRFVLDKGDGPVWLSEGWREDAQAVIDKAPMNPWRQPAQGSAK